MWTGGGLPLGGWDNESALDAVRGAETPALSHHNRCSQQHILFSLWKPFQSFVKLLASIQPASQNQASKFREGSPPPARSHSAESNAITGREVHAGVHVLFAISPHCDGLKAPISSVYISHPVLVFVLSLESTQSIGNVWLY